MKLIIGVIANDENGYSKMVEACRKTCYSEVPEDTSVYYIYGHRKGVETPETYKMDGDCFYNNSSESRNNLIFKTINFFEYCYNNLEFDYIFRPNCGSYINLDRLRKKIQQNAFPKDEVYLGIEGYFNGIKYAGGSGFLLSKDIVKNIVEWKKEIIYPGMPGFEMDDVSIGKFITEFLRIDITPGAERQILRLEDIIGEKNNINLECYHFYFNSRVYGMQPRCLYEIHKKIKERNGE